MDMTEEDDIFGTAAGDDNADDRAMFGVEDHDHIDQDEIDGGIRADVRYAFEC